MRIHFDPSIAASGGYDYLVDFLRGAVRQAKSEPATEVRVPGIEALLHEVGQQIEAAVAHSGDASNALEAQASVASPQIEHMLRDLTAGTDA